MASGLNFGLLNTNLPAQIGQSFQEGRRNAMADEQAANQNALMQYQLGKAKRSDEEETAFKNALMGVDTTNTASMRQAMPTLMKASPSQAMAFQKNLTEQEKAARDADKARLENGLKTLEAVGQLTAGVKDQATYDQAREKVASMFGPEAAANMSPTYNPDEIARHQQQAMSVKDRISNEWKAKGYDLDVAKFGETQRSNRVSEGISAGNLGVAKANLGLRQQEIQQGQWKYDAERGGLVNMQTGDFKPATQNGQPIAPKGKPPTEFQGKSAAYGARAEQADKIITQLGTGYSPSAVNLKQSVGSTPLIGGALEAGANLAMGSTNQKAEQAQRDFVNAVLRQESGAAISNQEFENAKKQYFPQPGDSKEVISQKAANRQLAIKGFKNSAAGASFSADTRPSIPSSVPKVNPQGWALHVDANGNKAYVGPNGQIQEVK